MQDDLRWNKLFGAVLGTALVMMVLGVGSQMVFAQKPPAKAGDQIAIKEDVGGAGVDQPADVPPDWGTVLATADVAAGATISTKCQTCHNFASGGPNEIGPNLWGVIGRPPGSHPGFGYSSAMQDFGKKTPVWDYAHVYDFLTGPQNYITGTKMSFIGLKKREDRINLIAWLRQQSSSPVAVPAPDPKAAAAGKAPADATGSAPAADQGKAVAAKPGASATSPVAVDGAAPVNGQTSSAGGVTPSSGAAASPSRMTSTNPGGPPLAGTTLGGSKALSGGTAQQH